jgi:hypothetical protein
MNIKIKNLFSLPALRLPLFSKREQRRRPVPALEVSWPVQVVKTLESGSEIVRVMPIQNAHLRFGPPLAVANGHAPRARNVDTQHTTIKRVASISSDISDIYGDQRPSQQVDPASIDQFISREHPATKTDIVLQTTSPGLHSPNVNESAVLRESRRYEMVLPLEALPDF